MKNFRIALFAVLISFYSCIATCNDVKKECIPLSYNILVISKSKSRDFAFKGYDKKGNYDQFQISQYWDFYDYVEKGDSIVKISGHTEIMLVKKDTTLIFPLMCRGKVVE